MPRLRALHYHQHPLPKPKGTQSPKTKNQKPGPIFPRGGSISTAILSRFSFPFACVACVCLIALVFGTRHAGCVAIATPWLLPVPGPVLGPVPVPCADFVPCSSRRTAACRTLCFSLHSRRRNCENCNATFRRLGGGFRPFLPSSLLAHRGGVATPPSPSPSPSPAKLVLAGNSDSDSDSHSDRSASQVFG